jgi:hypothetical protein
LEGTKSYLIRTPPPLFNLLEVVSRWLVPKYSWWCGTSLVECFFALHRLPSQRLVAQWHVALIIVSSEVSKSYLIRNRQIYPQLTVAYVCRITDEHTWHGSCGAPSYTRQLTNEYIRITDELKKIIPTMYFPLFSHTPHSTARIWKFWTLIAACPAQCAPPPADASLRPAPGPDMLTPAPTRRCRPTHRGPTAAGCSCLVSRPPQPRKVTFFNFTLNSLCLNEFDWI